MNGVFSGKSLGSPLYMLVYVLAVALASSVIAGAFTIDPVTAHLNTKNIQNNKLLYKTSYGN